MSTWRRIATKHPAMPYGALMIVVFLGGLLALSIYAYSRTVVTPLSEQRALQHCTSWVTTYAPEVSNPVDVCEAALKANTTNFVFRWNKGLGPN